MRALLARLLLRLAARSLGAERRQWARAMEVELRFANRDGAAIQFALGCLLAAWREMARHGEGRFALTSHALAVGIFVPLAALYLGTAAGLFPLPLGAADVHALAAPGITQRPYLDEAYRSARPVLLFLWVLLGTVHLRLAWLVLERDWARVTELATLALAATATMLIFTIVLMLDPRLPAMQVILLGVELTALYGAARWHGRLDGVPA